MLRVRIESGHLEANALRKALVVLESGGIIAYPTETVYGLGANIFCEAAVRRIFRMKKRPRDKAISIMIRAAEKTPKWCREIPEYANELMRAFWPGALTLVFLASQQVPSYLTGPNGKIGIRVPDHPVTRALLQSHQQPITSTSANISGGKEAVTAEEVAECFGNKIDLIIEGGNRSAKIPSTVLDVSGPKPQLLREGAILRKQINNVLAGDWT